MATPRSNFLRAAYLFEQASALGFEPHRSQMATRAARERIDHALESTAARERAEHYARRTWVKERINHLIEGIDESTGW